MWTNGTTEEKNEWNFVRTFGLLNSDSFHLIHLAARGDMDASTISLVFFPYIVFALVL